MRIFGRLAGGLAAVLTLAGVLGVAQTAQAAPAPPHLDAVSAQLADATTGAVLWSKDAQQKLPMASITKVMTALIVIEDGHLNQVITVPKGIIAYDSGGASTAGLAVGEKLTARQLLYAMLLPSGCDAAFTLASAYGAGNTATFVAAMNAKAKKLGLGRIHFADESGLPVNGQQYATYSSAHDLVVLGLDAMKLALLRQIVATRYYNVAAGPGHDKHSWTNLNQLLFTYNGAIGIKTGNTPAAGACLLFEARRGKKTLIGVVLHSSTSSLGPSFSDAEKLLNWGFAQ